jgi:hypothetical protein
MLIAASLLLAPIILTTSPNPTVPPSYNRLRAYVTGYNTVPAQTSPTPCTAADGADICGRSDTVACPRRIGFGTVVEIRGATFVCDDRLARKYDTRFDISCDKNFACPPEVTGWTTINVYGAIAPMARPAAYIVRQAGIRRRECARPAHAVASSAPAMTRTPSSSLAAILASVPISRKATPLRRHAPNTRSRAAAISGG